MSHATEIQRPRIMSWTRKFGEPLRATYPVDADDSEQFIELLAQADRRVNSDNGSSGHSEGA